MACPVTLGLVCDAVGGATSSVAGGVLSAIAGWVVSGATWLLNELGKVITTSTTVNVQASWYVAHYRVMLAIAAVVAVPMLMLAAVQAVYQQSAAVLLRAAFVHLPLAGLLTAVAVQLVQLALTATDALCTTVTSGTGGDLQRALTSVGTVLSHQLPPMPTFVMTIGAFLIVSGAFVLWLELLVRAAAIYAAVLFLPLALASLMWPAVSHWCRRLVETIVALVLSKFVVVAVLSLAVGAISSGGGFSTVLAGGALLLLAAFTPFTLLRLVPLVEVGAAAQLEGARQRVRSAVGRTPDSAVAFAMRQAREHGAHRGATTSPGTPGSPGTGTTVSPGVPGSGGGAGLAGAAGAAGTAGAGAATGAGAAAGGEAAGAIGRLGAGAGSAASTVGDGGGRGVTDAARRLWESTDDVPGQLPLGPIPREWVPPVDLTVPPGTIPVWEGSPESVLAALDAANQPFRVEPDGYGGIIPGIPSPLWGGTEPLSRFEPGPKDDWGDWSSSDVAPDVDPTIPTTRGRPPFVNWSPPDGTDGTDDDHLGGA